MSAFMRLLRIGLEAIAASLKENPYQTESGMGDKVKIEVIGANGELKDHKEVK